MSSEHASDDSAGPNQSKVGVSKQPLAFLDSSVLIALIESDDLILHLLERWLSMAGHVTHSISVQALRSGTPFDLIVADVAGAAAAAERVAAVRAAHRAPLLLISARFRHGAVNSAAMAVQLGVEAALPKPFTCDELMAAVASAVQSPRG